MYWKIVITLFKYDFCWKSRYDRIFQQVTHTGGGSAINYIKIFQKAQVLSVSVVNSYSEDQLMHTFLDNFHQCGRYSTQIASHHAELRIEETFTDKKYLSISSLQTDYLNLDSCSSFGRNSEISNTVQTKCNFCWGNNHSAEKRFKSIRQVKEKSCAAGYSDNRQTEHTPRKRFRCGSEDDLIENLQNHQKKIRNGESKYILMKRMWCMQQRKKKQWPKDLCIYGTYVW